MIRTKPIDFSSFQNANLYDSVMETTDVFNKRNGRTFKFNLKVQLGKKVDGRKKKFEKGHSHGNQSGMDMGY